MTLENCSRQRLGEDIGHHVMGRDVGDRDLSISNMLPNKVLQHAKVFGASVEDRVLGERNSALIVSKQTKGRRCVKAELGEEQAKEDCLLGSVQKTQILGFRRQTRHSGLETG
ncbi:BQ5605_C017g08329 [Microbotryum silenes-dioicae]|uniref:BQ5605_C017g08329 protein n=1 Tax=Microbotryum silenes-dioicae TaxID=796604 RepID=A0A2X0MG45_9BASI|nr:BQ5605_C017g08329 [Microbotryum silenes-dioicae]